MTTEHKSPTDSSKSKSSCHTCYQPIIVTWTQWKRTRNTKLDRNVFTTHFKYLQQHGRPQKSFQGGGKRRNFAYPFRLL